jgi:hypothetical protein
MYVEEGREVLEDEDDEDALGKEGQLIFEHEEEIDPEDKQVLAEEEEEEVEFDERDGEEDFHSDEDDGYSPHSDLIVLVLRTIDEIKYPEDIADNIEEAVKVIKGWKKMSTHAKRIRINFFATQR